MNVAIVGPAFFGYLRRIANLLTSRGVPAEFYDEFPSNKIFAKILLRYSPLVIRQRVARQYHIEITDKIISSGVTHVLFGTIEMFPHDCVRRLQDHGIVMCRYAWDSVVNKPYAKTLDPFLRGVASFDPVDCKDRGYRYVPLFSAVSSPAMDALRDVDFFYCATFHSNRPFVIKKVIAASAKAGWALRLMLFFHSKRLWLTRFAFHPEVWGMRDMFSTKPYSLDEIAAATVRAQVVIDIHHQGQNGLTMRTFEALSLGAIVLTTNAMALSGLPAELCERVVILDINDVDGSMRQALGRSVGALSPDMAYYLSSDRFLDQITALLLGVDDFAAGFGAHFSSANGV